MVKLNLRLDEIPLLEGPISEVQEVGILAVVGLFQDLFDQVLHPIGLPRG
jgi:hypothetical protein